VTLIIFNIQDHC